MTLDAQAPMPPADPRTWFQDYRAEHRTLPALGYTLEVFPDLSRYTADTEGHQGFVIFADLDPATAEDRIDEQFRHFAKIGQAFEWTVCEFDEPASLKTRLEARGFGCEHAEAIMVKTLDEWIETDLQPTGVRIEQIVDRKGLEDFVAVEEAVWQNSFPTHLARFSRELEATPSAMSFYCAYVADQPVSAGRIAFPAGSRYASLWGGSVVPALRSRGIYSAMLARRLNEAKARGYHFITVDAEPMSRPILLRKGFRQMCWAYPMCRQ